VGGSQIHDAASETDAEAGTVIVDGPGGTTLSLTPSAAEETGNRLKGSAAKAQEQRDGKRPPFDAEKPSTLFRPS
jgi:hypothetical protein